MTHSLSEIRGLVEKAHRVLLISHVMPDGDTLGSALGLAWALRKRGLEARLSCADPVPKQLRFLPGSREYAPRPKTDEDAILSLTQVTWNASAASTMLKHLPPSLS